MPEGLDRRISRPAGLALWAVVLFMVFAAAGLFFWSRMEPTAPSPQAAPPGMAVRPPAGRGDVPVSIMLYYPASGALAVEPVGVKGQFDAQSQAHEALSTLFAHQRAGQAAVIKDLRLRALYLDSTGTAFVDLSPASEQRDVRGSAWDEQMAIYAMVNTLTQNFEEIKEVHFLLDGREAQTIAGHIDASLFFSGRPDLARQ